jgi:hypothetical protein
MRSVEFSHMALVVIEAQAVTIESLFAGNRQSKINRVRLD